MNVYLCIVGALGFFFCAAFERKINSLGYLLVTWCRQKKQPHSRTLEELNLVREILRQLRAGFALETILKKMCENATPSQYTILREASSQDPKCLLAHLLRQATESGCSITAPLSLYADRLQLKLKTHGKIQALTSQARAQANVLSWLPVVLFFSLCLLETETLFSIWKSSTTYLLSSLLLFFMGLGMFWIEKMQSQVFLANSFDEKVELSLLPEILLSWIVYLSSGKDSDSSWKISLDSITPNDRKKFLNSDKGKYLMQIASQSAQTGVAIREELLQFFDEHLHQMENRWEEKAHRLPVKLLAPLFICYLPACFLSLGIFFLPILKHL